MKRYIPWPSVIHVLWIAVLSVIIAGCPSQENAFRKAMTKGLFNICCQGCNQEGGDADLIVCLPGNVKMELMYIPAGSFQMGRYAGEQDSMVSEDLRHEVVLSNGFYMGKYEVTQAQWRALMESWPSSPPYPPYGEGNQYPLYGVTWNEAQDFMTALNAHIVNTRQGPATVRLPSEAEMEYACRAGTTTRFYWGDDPAYAEVGDYAWHVGNNPGWAEPGYGPKPVGGKLPNAFGLYDMSGNVWEWCEDDYHDNYTGAPADGSAWVDSPRGTFRVSRGGGWNYDPEYSRSASRNYSYPENNNPWIGLRVLLIKS